MPLNQLGRSTAIPEGVCNKFVFPWEFSHKKQLNSFVKRTLVLLFSRGLKKVNKKRRKQIQNHNSRISKEKLEQRR